MATLGIYNEDAAASLAQAPPPQNSTSAAEDDVKLLARLIYSEAQGEYRRPKAMEAIGWIVRNRMASGDFPGTLQEVVLGRAPKGAKQFTAVGNPFWKEWENRSSLDAVKKRAYDRSLEAARNVLTGKVEDPTGGSLFYYNSDTGEPPPDDTFFREGISTGELYRVIDPIGPLYFFKQDKSKVRNRKP